MVAIRGRDARAERGRAALARVLAASSIELLPLPSVRGQIGALPPASQVSVTASPGRGLEATVELAVTLTAAGHQAVPHLAARSVRDRAHLRALLARMADGGVDRAFVVGGDEREPGAYVDGLALLRAIADLGPPLREVGIPCYPDGHPLLSEHTLLASLREKAPYAAYMTSQLCFDARRIERWVRARRAEGLALPLVIGVPGLTEPHRLVTIGTRIGVRDASRFLRKNVGLVSRLLRSGGFYRPDALLRDLAPLIADPAAMITSLHLYTFNAVAATVAWRSERLAALAEPSLAVTTERWVPAGPGSGWLTPGDPH